MFLICHGQIHWEDNKNEFLENEISEEHKNVSPDFLLLYTIGKDFDTNLTE